MPTFRQAARRLVCAILLCSTGAWSGCGALGKPIVGCPLTFSEQQKEVLAIAPKGTRRDEVLRRLSAAGIEGSFATSQRIYYCDLWQRTGGERWHLNVALLFDEAGKLYKVQTADCDMSSDRPGSRATDNPAEPAAASVEATGDPSRTDRPQPKP